MKKLPYVIGLAIFTGIIFSSLAYLFSGYDRLVAWYTGLNNCFYRSSTWSTDFFTPGIKSDGNMYCIIAIAIALTGLIFSVKHLQSPDGRLNIEGPENEATPVRFSKSDIVPVIVCLVSAGVLWQWGNKIALPAYDEVFSARNAAGIHPFQCMSYYMLPNNHLFFNLLNDLLFHSAGDKVATGRLISLFAYAAFMIAVFFGFKKIINNRWLALMAGITLAMQLLIWGFSFQARGYELYLLAGWGLIISMFSYIFSQQKRWLYINKYCIVFGYFCLPSFFYIHAAQVVFMLLYLLFYKKKEALFWKTQLSAMLLTFLLYLPALCFSGLEAIVHNSYVTPMSGCKTVAEFWQWGYSFFMPYIAHIFSDVSWRQWHINNILFLLPLLLLLDRKNKVSILSGMFYLTMWLVFFLIATVMNRLPFERNLVTHYSFTLAALLYLLYMLSGLIKHKPGRWLIFSIVLIAFAFHFIATNPSYLKDTLYEYDVNTTYTKTKAQLSSIPPGSTVAFSEQSFFCLYIYRKQGFMADKCDTVGKDYFVKRGGEYLPPVITDNYESVNRGDDYEIFRKK